VEVLVYMWGLGCICCTEEAEEEEAQHEFIQMSVSSGCEASVEVCRGTAIFLYVSSC